MASFASSATTCGARKHAWTNYNLYIVLNMQKIKHTLCNIIYKECKYTWAQIQNYRYIISFRKLAYN